jgi:hypothetical protein
MKTLLAFLAACAVFLSFPAAAKPVGQVSQGDMRIVFHDEPCKLKEVINLKYRATWLQGGKTYEGCWSAHQQYPIVVTYWADSTVGIIPLEVVGSATEI